MTKSDTSRSNQMNRKEDNSLFFLTSAKEAENIVFFLDQKYQIKRIILNTSQNYFSKLSTYSNKIFSEAIAYLDLNQEKLYHLIEQTKSTLFEKYELSDNKLNHEYLLMFVYTEPDYVLIFTLIDRTNDALKAYINTIINALPGAIYWKDTEGRYMGCNQFVAKMAGFNRPEQIIGKTDFDLCWNEFAQDWRTLDLEVMQENKTYKKEESVKLANGKIITEFSIKSPLYNEKNEIVGIIGISMDITEQKTLQQDLIDARQKAEAASHAKTEFLENMRHDIRTPLTGIVGFADIIKMEANNPQLSEYADNLVASSHSLLDLLDEVLEAIRVNSGEIPKLKKKFNLLKSLQQIIELNRAKAAHKKLALSLDFDATIPTYVIGDKVRIHRIALELIANALNFTDTGFVKLSVVLAKRNQQTLILKLVVEDSGIGIPKDKQQEIYVQFKRLTPSYQGIYKGVGLGLAVVKQFIDELGAEIYVESETRKGSRFTCIIPLQEPLLDDDLGLDEETEATIDTPYETTFAQQIKPMNADLTQHRYHVLVVEDNPIAQMVAKSILDQLNCDVETAETGRKAVDLWKTSHYDLIFMDIGLPDFDGYEVTHQIRIQELARKTHTPIIALTAHVGDENKKRCIEAGMNAVLSKPLTVKNCTDILDAFIPGHHQQETQLEEELYLSELPKQEDHLFTLSEFPLLDSKEGMRTAGNEATLIKMLTLMINDTLLKDLELLKEAHAVPDWDKIQQIAHKIKGGAVYVGTVKMKMACQYLERYWKSGQHELLEKLYQQVVAVIERSMQEVKDWLEDH